MENNCESTESKNTNDLIDCTISIIIAIARTLDSRLSFVKITKDSHRMNLISISIRSIFGFVFAWEMDILSTKKIVNRHIRSDDNASLLSHNFSLLSHFMIYDEHIKLYRQTLPWY